MSAATFRTRRQTYVCREDGEELASLRKVQEHQDAVHGGKCTCYIRLERDD